jgi:hypothetical protein
VEVTLAKLGTLSVFRIVHSPAQDHGKYIAIWYGIRHDLFMKTIISMDSSGRLVLPKRIRRSLNAPRSATFEAEVLGNRLELTLTEPPPAKLRLRGKLLVVPRQGRPADAVRAVEETREDRS